MAMRFHAKPWSQNLASRYVGIPFVPGGRDRTGLDCWGLVCLVYREAFGIELDEHPWVPEPRDRVPLIQSAVFKHDTPWRPMSLDEVALGDVLLFAVLGHPAHVGLHLSADTMLHAHEGLGVTLDRWGCPTWRSRFRQVYRHEARTP